jgi:hypothetical protein
MERRFGHDFGAVRVHAGTEAARSAHAIHAHAYTFGRHVVMGQDRYRPGTQSGAQLLAHELTHVVQQGGASGETAPPRAISCPHDPAEHEADEIARAEPAADSSASTGHPATGAEVGLIHRQDEDEASFGGGSFGGGGASGSWAGPDDPAAPGNVSMVDLSCRSPTDGSIDFHLTGGKTVRYRLTRCELTPGGYTARVEVKGRDLALRLDTPGDVLFDFAYAVEPGQQDPSTFFGGQSRVDVRVGAAAPAPGPARLRPLPLVCSRPLDVPAWTGLQRFRHAFINDPPANYAIRGPLVSGNGVTTSCSPSTDNSGDPDVPATSTCKWCRQRPGQTREALSICLRATHSAYPNPSLYRNLPDPKDGWRHGPNSNSYAAAMARCCDDFTPDGLGRLPGWNHSPAGPCRPTPATDEGPADDQGPAPEAPEEPIRDAGPSGGAPGGLGLTGEDAAPRDLHAFGSTTKPRDPRLGKDIDPNPDGSVGPEPKEPPWPNGASTFGDVEQSGLTGHYHRIAAGTRMASGLRVIADGRDVGGPASETHHTIFPVEQMPFPAFVDRFQGLGWAHAGKR